ncbi:50S ribosomal protein L18 [Desulfoglaeba alkanexedens]|jgi:large subunit ribosomal protein L18|uniref:Large ribosomal subunit protein uL18 n=1 Tax=Desulfoglaeba alkanexedens ALDC TaxID=980445 RepID=A0A4P8L2Q3_9BACT|nr:50S ribosomal protein L18 [Desulfoglaeba alkanexedens]QCQ21042.1 50S ribosomal protein L18 [Desulfoglaeba alkanexedens ALDC]
MTSKKNPREQARLKRKKRIRTKVKGTPDRPRLTVFRSAKHIYAQIIDDTRGVTLAASSTLLKDPDLDEKSGGKVQSAERVGERIAREAMERGIRQVVFDRNGFIYHGRIRAVADGARKAGLDF